jgi:hypothetical protein
MSGREPLAKRVQRSARMRSCLCVVGLTSGLSCALDERVVAVTETASELPDGQLPAGELPAAAQSDTQSVAPRNRGGTEAARGGAGAEEAPAPSTPSAPPGSQPVLPEAPPAPAVALHNVEVAASGAAFGRVRSSPPGIDCSSPPCRAAFPAGTSVTLQAWTPDAGGFGFAGWSGACAGLDSCVVSVSDADVRVAASYEPANRVFVSSTRSNGNIGGVAAADARCAALAQGVGLEGEFRAWLSTAAVSAIDRVAGSRGWVRLDDKGVADAPQDLLQGRLYYPIRLDESGRDVGDILTTWTGTDGTGRLLVGQSCDDWTSNVALFGATGTPSWLGTGFTFGGSTTCGEERPIYCFEVGRTVRIAPTPAEGRLAFVTRAGFATGSGSAAADALCQSEAVAAQRSGSFKAVIATTEASPASRFDLGGPPWVRVDGIRLAPTAAAFFSAAQWDSAPNVTLRGEHAQYLIVSGGSSLNQPGVAADTCSNWSSRVGSVISGRAVGTAARTFFYEGLISLDCGAPAPLACLEE